jgi:hypothetical protein
MKIIAPCRNLAPFDKLSKKAFKSIDGLEKAASFLYGHRLNFGLKIHISTGVTPSKTEKVYFPPSRYSTLMKIPCG